MKGRERCGAPCNYWRGLPLVEDGSTRLGECRIAPPVFSGEIYALGDKLGVVNGPRGKAVATNHPVTLADDWCGSFAYDGAPDRGIC